MSFVLVNLCSMHWITALRSRINAHKDKIEEACIGAVELAIAPPGIFATIAARHTRRVLQTQRWAGRHNEAASGAASEHGAAAHELAPLSDREVWLLGKMDTTGEMMRDSPLKVLITILNLAVFFNGIQR